MSRRLTVYLLWAALAGGLYFFENNTGTRIVLICSLLLPLIPPIRRAFFAADQTETQRPLPVTLRTFSYPEDEDGGGVRPYQPGDPVNRVHWKLSAKRNELLIRENGRETLPAEEKADRAGPEPRESAARNRKKGALLCAAGLAALLLCLLLIPAARLGAQALCNRLFEASERVNAYVYDRFPVPAEQSVIPAVLLLACAAALLPAILFLTRSRPMAFCLMAGVAAFQMYFGLALPGWANVALFSAFALWTARRPLRRGEALMILAAVLTAALAVTLVCPGVDAATEAASERARDALSRLTGQTAGTIPEAAEGENETRHVHTRTLTEGDREAAAEKEYRLETLEEQQISRPGWFSWLKTVLLLLAAAALVILPFLPFLWLNARRRKALEARRAFASENVSEAVCAIFRQTAAWLEAMGCGAGNLPFRAWAEYLPEGMEPGYELRFGSCAALFEEAAYSDHTLDEERRQEALALLQETERAMLARADWKQKLRLKYGDCLWTENA